VDWLLVQPDLSLKSRREALDFGNMLMGKHFFHHVVYDHPLKDDFYFYRLLKHENCKPTTLNVSMVCHCEPRNASEVSRELRMDVAKIYDEFLSADGGSINYVGMAKSESWKRYKNRATELQRTDISSLNREEKLAFFLNIYNVLVINANVEVGPPVRIFQRYKFFNKISYVIGGFVFSLNDIEHGILRSNAKPPYSRRTQFSRNDPRLPFILKKSEPRIHFALVCGARSCPAIKLYDAEHIDEQLDLAARGFLESECELNENKKEIRLSKIMDWYHGDFGATHQEMLRWVCKYLPEDKAHVIDSWLNNNVKFKLSFMQYDWSSNL